MTTTDEIAALLLSTTDAQVWAEEFQRVYRHLVHQGYADPHQKPVDDTGWLIGWFANALEVGRSAGAAPFGGEGVAMTGYDIAAAMEEGRKIQVRFLTEGDATWWLAGDTTDDHPEGTPPSWYREHLGQINVVARDVSDAPEFEGERMSQPKPVESEESRLRRWKAEAMEVLGDWDKVFEALGSPGQIGASKAASALAAVQRLTAASEGQPLYVVRGSDDSCCSSPVSLAEAVLEAGHLDLTERACGPHGIFPAKAG